jgi:Kef-type K+ transport system membrane component KefB
MNKYEKRADQDRKAALRSSILAGTIGLVLIAIALVVLGVSSSAPLGFYKKTAIAIIVLLLILRYIGRKLKKKSGGPAQPDPQSKLNLH